MTSLLAGTVAHGAHGGRGVSTSHHRRTSPGLSGTPGYSPELPGNGSHNTVLLTVLSSIFKDSSLQVRSPHREWIKHWVVNLCRFIRLF